MSTVFLVFGEGWFGGSDECRRIFSTLELAQAHAERIQQTQPGNGLLTIQKVIVDGEDRENQVDQIGGVDHAKDDGTTYYQQDEEGNWVRRRCIWKSGTEKAKKELAQSE